MKMKTPSPSRILCTSISTLLAFAALASVGHAATKIWDGGPAGTGTDLVSGVNWSGDTQPAQNDILQWNGTAAGNLALTLTNSTSLSGGTGYFMDVTAAQTGSLQIDNVTIDANSGNVPVTTLPARVVIVSARSVSISTRARMPSYLTS